MTEPLFESNDYLTFHKRLSEVVLLLEKTYSDYHNYYGSEKLLSALEILKKYNNKVCIKFVHEHYNPKWEKKV